MNNRKLTHLALLISLAASPLVLAQKPADQTSPEQKTQSKAEAVAPSSTTVVEEKVVVVPAAPAAKQGSLTDLISDSVTFSTLEAALKAAELDVTLGQKGVYTIFAPTDEAFDKLPLGTLGKLMLPENKEKLRSLLLYHVIPGQMLAVDLKDGQVITMNGEKVKFEVDDGTVEIDGAKVFSTDVMANNGVMHSIGNVIFPKSMEGFSGLDK
ncbi:MAG: fasciclin domain-containing protein [Verrucomicrobiota bacterium]